MASVWRVEITWGPVINNPNNNPSLFLTTTDSNTGRTFAINVVRDDGSGNTGIQLFLSADEFGLGTFISGTSTLTGVGTGAYDGGGTIAFEKDFDLDEFRFITPLGTQTRTATSLSVLNINQLEIFSHGMAITRNPTNVDTSASVFWNNAYLKQDGATVSGAELTDIDPGMWFGWSYSSSGGSGGDIPSDNAQTVTAYRSRLVYNQASDNPKNTTTREARIWRGGNNITANPFRLLIDAMCHPVTGEILWVRVPFEDHTTVLFGRSDDGGATLTEIAIVTGGDDYSYPTLAVDPNGRLWCFWRNENDKTQLYGSVSENGGRSWSAMVTQSFPGVASKTGGLRLRFHPISGTGLLVTRVLALTSLVVWVWDVGDPATQVLSSPFTVRDAGDSVATVYPTIVFPADGATLVLTNVGLNRHVYRSENFGVSWVDFDNALATDYAQPMMVGTTPRGLFAFLSQDRATGDLFAFVSDNLFFQPPIDYATSPVAAVSGADQQYAALAVGPKEEYYMLYQEQVLGVYTVKCRHSDNWGRAWNTP